MKDLPCFPCPHKSACCNYGVYLSPDEAAVITASHGADKVRRFGGGFRTRTKDGKCVFLVDNACALHGSDAYPSTCRGFPWHAEDGASAYKYDVSICPELPDVPASQLTRRRT